MVFFYISDTRARSHRCRIFDLVCACMCKTRGRNAVIVKTRVPHGIVYLAADHFSLISATVGKYRQLSLKLDVHIAHMVRLLLSVRASGVSGEADTDTARVR